MSTLNIALYFSFVFLGMLYIFYKVGLSRVSLLLVLVFWEGFFDYLDTVTISGLLSIYKICVVFYAVSISWKKRNRFKNKADLAVNFTFLLFTVSFWITYYFYGGVLLTILSQYLYKYAFLWIAYHYLKDIIYNIPKREYVKNVLLNIIYVQIAVAVFKIILMGFKFEGLVGTMSYGGGGPAVVIPIMAMIFYWLIQNGKFTKKDWIVTGLILIIAIASGKRQPIIIFPAILFFLFVFVARTLRLVGLLKYLIIALIVFYVGVRMTPTITPEKKVGGSFDISFVSNYIKSYYFGTDQARSLLDKDSKGIGRGAALYLYFKPEMLTLESNKEILFGKGVYEVAIGKYGRFTAGGRSDYGIKHEGLIGEGGALIYTLGYMGSILLLVFVASIIFSIKNKKLAWIIFFYFLWDILLYYNQMIFFNSSGLIVLIIIFYSNSLEREKVLNLKRNLNKR
ncbi:hypothetical protein [Polaribacter porphyrae]|uniref:Oligosaccharide repeat unit polymerase n=1 Tax=Polaribacter porphyrae TaxID=1137780 RepID=A0A2S7WJH8_9FLAO|nr:hypothetical protein [Polaribacter porphyrae]PQJ77769.1 hypothetical protein BTO18_00570 [Polaribacter porphyrae]